jgi:predicted GNAT family N-acyltransferase
MRSRTLKRRKEISPVRSSGRVEFSSPLVLGQVMEQQGLRLVEVGFPCPPALRDAIGRLRVSVWSGEGSLDASLFPSGVWWDELDEAEGARHWVVFGDKGCDAVVVAAARLTWHASFDDDYRDVQLWKSVGADLPLPTCDLGRLVVRSDFRGRGVAQLLNAARVEAARAMGAKSVMATASEGNARLLLRIGFFEIGQTVVFADRPKTTFHALQMNL